MLENKIKFLIIKNPLHPEKRQEIIKDYDPNKSLADYLGNFPMETRTGVKLVAAVNGQLVKHSWDTVYPDEGSIVSITAEMEAAWAAGGIYAALIKAGVGVAAASVAAAVTYVAVTVAVGFGINTLMSAISGGYETPDTDGRSGNSPTYSWGALTPTEVEGHPIPIVYGEHKVAGQVINKFVTVTNESGEQEKSKEYLNMLLSVGEGPVDEITDIRINEQPYTNYKDVQIYTRLGGADDTVIPNFNKIVHQQELSFTLFSGEIYKVETTGNNIDSLEVVINAPYGLYYANDSGGLDTRTATAEIYYRPMRRDSADNWVPDGDWIHMGTAHFEDDTTEKVQVVKSVSDLEPNKYEVYVTKTSPDSDEDFKEERTLMWPVLKESISEDLSYPGIAKYGIKALATDQLSGSQPKVSCLVRKLTVSIYDPNTGTTIERSAKNPAWATYHFLTVHHGIDAYRLLYEEFEEWAYHCEELATNDTEEDTAEKVFGIVLDTQTTLWENAQRIARIGRASIVRRGTKIGVFVDRPIDESYEPTHMFTMGNILKESFVYQFLPYKDRANVIELAYSDPDREYTNQIVSVYMESYLEGNSLPKKTNIKFNAAISRNRAIQEAVYLLKSNAYLIRTVEFEAAIDSFACTVGDVVYFQHEIANYKDSYGGRLIQASDTYVELDSEVFVEAGVNYVILVRMLDGSIEEHNVETITADAYKSEFQLATAFSQIPNQNDLYLFGKLDTAKKLYRIINISRAEDHTRRISCIEYISDIYEPGGFIIPIEPPEVPQLAIGVTAKEFLTYANDGSYESNIAVSWYPTVDNAGSNWVVWLVDITHQDQNNTDGAVRVTQTSNLSTHIDNHYLTLGHEYKIYVTTIDAGPIDTGDNTAVVQILGKMAPPNNVSGFSAFFDPSLRAVLFQWNAVSNIDLSHYEIRRISDDLPEDEKIWDNAEIRIKEVTGIAATERIPEDGEEGVFLYMIKAVDTSGNESEIADTDTAEIDLSGLGNFLPQVDGLSISSNCSGTINTMTATWNTQVENHPYFSHYKIEKREYVNEPIYNTSYFETDGNTYTWEGVGSAVKYGIRVRAMSVASTAMLRGSWSIEVQHIVCSDDEPPEAPVITKLVPGYKVMGIHWNEGTWPYTDEALDIDYYQIRRREEGGEWVDVGSKKGTFTTDSDLGVEKKYCYIIRAFDTSGNASDWSEEACATTLKVGWSDLALDSLTAEYISVEYLSALAARMGVLISGYIVSPSFLENGWDIDGNELIYTGPEVTWDEVKKTWDGLYIDANHPMIYMGTSDTEHYVLLEPGRCEFYGVVNFWNSPEDFTKIDGGQIHAASSITIGTEDYCYIDDGDIEFYRWFSSLGEHKRVKSLKKIDIGEAVHGETKELQGYWASRPRITVWPKSMPTFNSNFFGTSQSSVCKVKDGSINYNSSTGRCSFVPLAYAESVDGNGLSPGAKLYINNHIRFTNVPIDAYLDDNGYCVWVYESAKISIPSVVNSANIFWNANCSYSYVYFGHDATEIYEAKHFGVSIQIVINGNEYEVFYAHDVDESSVSFPFLASNYFDFAPGESAELSMKLVFWSDHSLVYGAAMFDTPCEPLTGPNKSTNCSFDLLLDSYEIDSMAEGEAEGAIGTGVVYYMAMEDGEEE